MRTFVLAFTFAIFSLQFAAALPPLAAAPGALALGLVCLRRRSLPAYCIAGLLCGFGWAAAFAHLRLAEALPAAWEGRDVEVVGTVASLPDEGAQGVRFFFHIEQAAAPLPALVSLGWFGAQGRVHPGARWRLTLRLQRPHGNANPYGFDYEAWLLEQGVRATGSVRPAANNTELDAFVWRPGHVVERLREALRARILGALPEAPYAGVLVALVIGEQRGIRAQDWDVFVRTGISHLVSISGLHITMIAGLAAAAAAFLWRRSGLLLHLPAQKAAALAGALAALVYVLLAGFGVPAQRTLYMLTAVAIALWSGRITGATRLLCLALLAVLLLDPWALLAPGFWLSFGAVGVIFYAMSGRGNGAEGWRAQLAQAARLQWAITLGLVPLTLLLFGQLSLSSPLANAVAIPLVSFVVTPLALAGSVMPGLAGDWLLWGAHACMAALTWVLGWLAGPAAAWQAPVPPAWIFLLACTGLAWLLAPRGWPLRWLGLPALLPLLALRPAHPSAGEMWVTAFDVGQGMAVLVETAAHRLLYDSGPAYGPDADAGGRVLLPYLRGRGIAQLDALVISHNDADHSGGMRSLLRQLDIGWSASSLLADSPLLQGALRHRPCLAGMAWEWEGVRFRFLHPDTATLAQTNAKPNARSCVLRIEAGAHALLLAGDLEAAQEAQLLARGEDVHAEVLLAPHHGSGTSSTPAFLDAVQPRYALFQLGYRNRYRHPKEEVWQRYGERGIARLRSDRDGALLLRFGTTIEVESWRCAAPRYWQAQVPALHDDAVREAYPRCGH